MRLEDEIKQSKPFTNEFQKLFLNINVTNSWLNNIISEKLKPFKLTPHQYNVLRILKGKYPESYCNQEITQRMIDKSSNSTRIVDKLLKKNLVHRTENAIDRRLVSIKISDLGLILLTEINQTLLSVQLVFNGIDEEKARQMNDWLEKMRG